MARPTIYTPELAKRICDLISTHPWGLARLCKNYSDLPSAETIRLWKLNNAEFFALYTRAKTNQADFLAEEILDIADDDSKDANSESSISRDRLRIDTRKWLASKLIPKIYGAKTTIDMGSDDDKAKEMKEKLMELRKSLEVKYKRDY